MSDEQILKYITIMEEKFKNVDSYIAHTSKTFVDSLMRNKLTVLNRAEHFFTRDIQEHVCDKKIITVEPEYNKKAQSFLKNI